MNYIVCLVAMISFTISMMEIVGWLDRNDNRLHILMEFLYR